MLTSARIREDLETEEGVRWITALKVPQIQQLASDRVVEMRAALAHLLSVLRAESRIPAARTQGSPAVHTELQRYDSFLAEICGLAPATRISRLSWVGKMLFNCFGNAPVDLGQIGPRDIVDFMVRPDDSYRPGSMQVIASALRSYLRFRSLECGDDVQRLMTAVPTVAQWSLASLPSHLTPEEVTRFIAAFDQHSVSGLRGYAMARCLLDMGLRLRRGRHPTR
jgi:hypothetical protein